MLELELNYFLVNKVLKCANKCGICCFIYFWQDTNELYVLYATVRLWHKLANILLQSCLLLLLFFLFLLFFLALNNFLGNCCKKKLTANKAIHKNTTSTTFKELLNFVNLYVCIIWKCIYLTMYLCMYVSIYVDRCLLVH